MNEPKQYVLRQPVQVDLALNVEDHVAVYVDPYIECFEMRLASFESAFVSVEDIQQQIREQLDDLIGIVQADTQLMERGEKIGQECLDGWKYLRDEIIGVVYGKEKP